MWHVIFQFAKCVHFYTEFVDEMRLQLFPKTSPWRSVTKSSSSRSPGCKKPAINLWTQLYLIQIYLHNRVINHTGYRLFMLSALLPISIKWEIFKKNYSYFILYSRHYTSFSLTKTCRVTELRSCAANRIQSARFRWALKDQRSDTRGKKVTRTTKTITCKQLTFAAGTGELRRERNQVAVNNRRFD